MTKPSCLQHFLRVPALRLRQVLLLLPRAFQVARRLRQVARRLRLRGRQVALLRLRQLSAALVLFRLRRPHR